MGIETLSLLCFESGPSLTLRFVSSFDIGHRFVYDLHIFFDVTSSGRGGSAAMVLDMTFSQPLDLSIMPDDQLRWLIQDRTC